MGCAVSKKSTPVTPVYDSGELITSNSIWNRPRTGASEEHPLDREGHAGRASVGAARASCVSGHESENTSSVCTSSVSMSTGTLTSNSNSNGPKLPGNLHKYIEGEVVAAGWPAWLSSVAAEAVHGWIPLKADCFEKLEKIGQGTYSSVFKARELETGRIVALKKVRFDNFEPESVRFMSREILILRRLNHPNVIKLEGIITSRLSNNIYLVFEYMEHDLAGLTSSPDITFTYSQVKCYMNQLLSGLEHCHLRGIIHRDIKCANLLVSNDGILKVADFGLANFYTPGQSLTSRVVTLWYRPPELLLGLNDYNASVDLWSAGCVFAEMFMGKPFLQGRTEVEQIHKIFKMCGSPDEPFWRKPFSANLAVFKPAHKYESHLKDSFKNLPNCAFQLLEDLLSVEPAMRGTASSALKSEYFKTKPYACDPLSLPKYAPSREIDAKHREDARRRKVNNNKAIEASRRLARVNQPAKTTNTNTQNSSTTSYNASIPEDSIFSNKETSHATKRDHHRNTSGEANRLFVDLKPGSTLKRAEHEVTSKGPMHIVGPAGYAWADQRAKELARNTKPHYQYQHGAGKPPSGSLFADPYTRRGHDKKQKNTDKQALMKQWAHVDSGDCYKKRNQNTFNSGLLVQNFEDRSDQIEYSGPIMSQSQLVDDFLAKHEKHIRSAVRRSWFQKGR
ncbi:Kinase superfamily protein [Rhynchospora pubera]|uniref:[RNA-polymerase]-subunit kinase n=1 Tax=Rhynchospora pubera TaxID=906938 RepID=A0AAV8DMV5_9POAL|nr:Kinase superfamily protein [Rhynchospora pubera]